MGFEPLEESPRDSGNCPGLPASLPPACHATTEGLEEFAAFSIFLSRLPIPSVNLVTSRNCLIPQSNSMSDISLQYACSKSNKSPGDHDGCPEDIEHCKLGIDHGIPPELALSEPSDFSKVGTLADPMRASRAILGPGINREGSP